LNEKKKIGALWLKYSNGGKKLWTGNVEIDGKKTQIAMFANSYKNAENQPDFIVYFDDYKPSARPASKPMDDEFPSVRTDTDDVPF